MKIWRHHGTINGRRYVRNGRCFCVFDDDLPALEDGGESAALAVLLGAERTKLTILGADRVGVHGLGVWWLSNGQAVSRKLVRRAIKHCPRPATLWGVPGGTPSSAPIVIHSGDEERVFMAPVHLGGERQMDAQ